MASFEEKLRRGDKRAFEQLVREKQNRIYAACLGMMKNPHDAQDAAQETFIKAYRSIGNFRMESSLDTWLTKIAVNTCLDMLKRQKPSVSLDEDIELAAEETAESAAEKNTRVRAVRQALNELNPELRAALVLRDMDGLSYEEIAQSLDINIGTVRSRISRAREKIKKILLENRELF